MSRVGKLPIKIADGVKVAYADGVVTVAGKLGSLTQRIENKNIDVAVKDGAVSVLRRNDLKQTKAAHGLYRTLIANMVAGVQKGYEKSLVINGVGYKVQTSGGNLVLNIGYSHPVVIKAPEGITFECPGPTEITVKGIDKALVGRVAAEIKAARKPEPYHGYGVRYKNETILRKEGKAAGKK